MNFNINYKNLILAGGIKLIFLFTLFSGFSKEAVAHLSDDIKNRDVFAFEFLAYNSFQPEKSFLEVFCQIPTNDLQFVKFKEDFLVAIDCQFLCMTNPAESCLSKAITILSKLKHLVKSIFRDPTN